MRGATGKDVRNNWKRCEKQYRGMRSSKEMYKSQMRDTRETIEVIERDVRKL
jgi:hypothetical protein